MSKERLQRASEISEIFFRNASNLRDVRNILADEWGKRSTGAIEEMPSIDLIEISENEFDRKMRQTECRWYPSQ